jgi:hypothetical protein
MVTAVHVIFSTPVQDSLGLPASGFLNLGDSGLPGCQALQKNFFLDCLAFQDEGIRFVRNAGNPGPTTINIPEDLSPQ